MSKWKKTKLKNIVKFSSGEFLPSSKQKNGGIPVYGGNGITGWHDESIIDYSTVVIGRVGAYCGSIHLTNRKSWITDNAIFIKKILDELDIEYLFRYLSRLKINLLAEVSAQPKISQGILNSLSVQYPENKIEQQKIATILSNVDDLILSYDNIIDSTKLLKRGLMQTLLTRGIGHKKFKKVKWLFGKEIEIPEEWELTTLKETSYITDGSHASPPKTDNGLPMATVENIRDSIIDIDSCYKISKEDFEQLVKNNCKPEINDVLFTKDGTVGKSLVFTQNVDVVLLSSIAILKPFDKLDSVYLHYSFHSEAIIKFIAKYLGGTAIKRIVLKNLEKFLFPLPPLPEQEKIATILSNIDSQIQSQIQYKEKLEKLKKSLMQKLLTGEVRVAI